MLASLDVPAHGMVPMINSQSWSAPEMRLLCFREDNNTTPETPSDVETHFALLHIALIVSTSFSLGFS